MSDDGTQLPSVILVLRGWGKRARVQGQPRLHKTPFQKQQQKFKIHISNPQKARIVTLSLNVLKEITTLIVFCANLSAKI